MIAHMFLAGNIEEGYTVTPGFMQDMLHRFKDQKLIHRRYAFAIILQVSLPTMLSHYVVFLLYLLPVLPPICWPTLLVSAPLVIR